MTEEFLDDDAGYIAYVRANPSCFVLNSHRIPSAAYLVIHRARCRTFGGPPRTSEFLKVCSESVEELEDWAGGKTGAYPDRCRTCQP